MPKLFYWIRNYAFDQNYTQLVSEEYEFVFDLCQLLFNSNQDPEIPVMFSMKRCATLVFLFYSGLLPFIPIKESFLEIMLPVTMIRLVHVSVDINLYSLTSVCIFSLLFFIHFQRGLQGEFVWQSWAALVRDHLLYSHHFHVWFRGDIVGRN